MNRSNIDPPRAERNGSNIDPKNGAPTGVSVYDTMQPTPPKAAMRPAPSQSTMKGEN